MLMYRNSKTLAGTTVLFSTIETSLFASLSKYIATGRGGETGFATHKRRVPPVVEVMKIATREGSDWEQHQCFGAVRSPGHIAGQQEVRKYRACEARQGDSGCGRGRLR
jgi:hypothetical protein